MIIADTSGKLTLGEGANAQRDKLRRPAEGGSMRILLNMPDVTYIHNSGLGELVAAYATVTKARGELKLLNLATRAHGLLKITKL